MQSNNSESKLVLVYPDPLKLTHINNSNYYESKLNLTNLTNEYVIFKLFNNQRSLYNAKPSTSFLPPKENAKVSIKRFKKDEDSQVGKDKFLLLFYTINRVINDNEEAKEAFKQKTFNENSKQESMISIILKDQEEETDEPTYTYDESVLEGIGDDYIKGIKTYSELNDNLNKQINAINEKIRDSENELNMIKRQKEMQQLKDKAMKDKKAENKSNDKGLSKILLICLILLGLVIGANFAKGYNRLFHSKQNIDDVIAYKDNQDKNIINENINNNVKNENPK
jgi:hypothetical protein